MATSTIDDTYGIDFSNFANLRNLLNMTQPEAQESIIRIMMTSFHDPKQFAFYIDGFSPTEELRLMRHTIWQLIR